MNKNKKFQKKKIFLGTKKNKNKNIFKNLKKKISFKNNK